MINLTRLNQLMTENDMNMTDLAAASGVSYSTIYSIHKVRRANTSSATINKLAKALHASANDLLQGGAGDLEEEMPGAVKHLAQIAAELSEARQEELVRIADALKKLEKEEGYFSVDRQKMLTLLHAAENLPPGAKTADLLRALQELGGD